MWACCDLGDDGRRWTTMMMMKANQEEDDDYSGEHCDDDDDPDGQCLQRSLWPMTMLVVDHHHRCTDRHCHSHYRCHPCHSRREWWRRVHAGNQTRPPT